MKRFALLFCFLIMAPTVSAAPFVMPPEMKACRIWQIAIPDQFVSSYLTTKTQWISDQTVPAFPVISGNVGVSQFNGTTAVVDSASMRVLQAKVRFRSFGVQWREERLYLDADRQALLQSEALATLAMHLTTGNGAAQCLAIGTESSLVGDQLRAYLDAEVQKTVKASVDAQMAAFLTAIRSATDTDRAALIERALQELPKNASLLEALKNAMRAPTAGDAPSR